MLKKSLALTVLAVLIVTSVYAKDIEINFSNKNQEAVNAVYIDAKNLYNQDWISIEIFDYNKDNKADQINFLNCVYTIDLPARSAGTRKENIEFYRGDQKRKWLKRVYYNHPCKDMKEIADTETGVFYDSPDSIDKDSFKPVKDERINRIFFLADLLLNIEKNPAANFRIMELLGMRVIDFPETWKIKHK